jgi:hypothetical protein
MKQKINQKYKKCRFDPDKKIFLKKGLDSKKK